MLGRRPLPSWVVLPGGTAAPSADASPTHPKLTTFTTPSFLTYSPELQAMLKEQDACIWALGSTQVGKTEEQYTELTEGFMVAHINTLRALGVGSVARPFRLVFISAEGADPSGKSRVLFKRVKVGSRLLSPHVLLSRRLLFLYRESRRTRCTSSQRSPWGV